MSEKSDNKQKAPISEEDAAEFRGALAEMGMSQNRFATMVEMDVTSVNRWARAKAAIPGVAKAYVRLLLSIHRVAFGRAEV